MPYTLYRDQSFTVTTGALRTPRRTFHLRQVEQTRLSRPGALAGLLFGAACWGLVRVFGEILYANEIRILIAAPILVLPLALQIGVLTLEYRGLGGTGRVIGRAARLARVREAIDDVLEAREGRR